MPNTHHKTHRWYSTAGTPTVTVDTSYNATERTFTLTATQHIPNQANAAPLLIPIATALLAADGQLVPLTLQGGEALGDSTVCVGVPTCQGAGPFIRKTPTALLQYTVCNTTALHIS